MIVSLARLTTKVERMVIRWPSGKTQILDEVPVDRRIFVREE